MLLVDTLGDKTRTLSFFFAACSFLGSHSILLSCVPLGLAVNTQGLVFLLLFLLFIITCVFIFALVLYHDLWSLWHCMYVYDYMITGLP